MVEQLLMWILDVCSRAVDRVALHAQPAADKLTPLTHDEFMRLPINLKHRYWEETDYSRLPVSADLLRRLRAEILKQDCAQLMEAGHTVIVRNGKAEVSDGRTNWG